MDIYKPGEIEPKWQRKWEEEKYKSQRAEDESDKPKKYLLVEFPYPSGAGLHVGHVRSYTALDVLARQARLKGENVLYPIGWDAFGLPAENYAIKNKIKPRQATEESVATFRRQLKRLGLSFDWSREVNTTDPDYYKWTQWIFLEFFKRGLAYKAKQPINWCPACKIGLANEEVVNGKCERCGTEVVKKEKEQWMLRITEYAERLLNDLELVDYSERIKQQQVNWIGRSEGYKIKFSLTDIEGQEEGKHTVEVFTTRIDTIYGATFIAVSPELAKSWLDMGWQATNEVRGYIEESIKRRDVTREEREKTGVDTGMKAINPATGEEISVWVADYVLAGYGTGAIMAVPAHDERDWELAEKYKLPIREVVVPYQYYEPNPPREGKPTKERKNVHAIVKNPKTGKILAIKWKKFPWTTFPMGGIEENEEVVEAARREVLEETGYKNLNFVKILGGQVKAEYFAAHKDENRISYTRAVCFELGDEEREEIDPEEAASHEIIWLNPSKVNSDDMIHAELPVWLERLNKDNKAYEGEGVLINSGEFEGEKSEEVREKIANKINGKKEVNYHLRDWVFSRQHYWGEPIPIIICDNCGFVPVSESDLPVKLPEVEYYEPTDTGESPLSVIDSWVRVRCPKCGGEARRETDTMPNWAGSSWYFLRYLDPNNNEFLAGREKIEKWMPIDLYNGGMEHTTLHLLYSRFWFKFLYDLGVIPESVGVEPYRRRRSHGVVLAKDNQKMSKSRGNVVNPDEMIEKFGADALRIYELFMGPFSEAIPWNTDGLKGVYRFLEKVWNLQVKLDEGEEDLAIEEMIKKIEDDLAEMKFNTVVSAMMIQANLFSQEQVVNKESYRKFITILSALAPHIAMEIAERQEMDITGWPEYKRDLIKSSRVKIVIQVDGKYRGELEMEPGSSEEGVIEEAKSRESINKWLEGGVKRVIYVPERIINFVTR